MFQLEYAPQVNISQTETASAAATGKFGPASHSPACAPTASTGMATTVSPAPADNSGAARPTPAAAL